MKTSNTELVVIEQANALAIFKSSDHVETIIQKIETNMSSIAFDASTEKGRKEIASMAYKVSRTKTYIDNIGKDLAADLKEIPKLVDASRKQFRDRLDALRDKIRGPLTEYEEEQERIKAEEVAKKAAEELGKQIDSDYEIAILMNREFDREREELRQQAETERIAKEEKLKQEAAEKAKKEAEEKVAAEIMAAQLAAEKAKLEQQVAIARAEREKQEALANAEREKHAAIEAERQKAIQAEQERIRAEHEKARQLEQERLIAKQNAEDIEHRRAVNNQALVDLITAGVYEEFAKIAIKAIASGKISHTSINY